mgnify:FL=1
MITNKRIIKKEDLFYPDESYKVVGCSFDVYNKLGGGHHEKFYQRALSQSFNEQKLNFKEQVYFPLKYNQQVVGRSFFDFLVEGKIIVEIKKGNNFSRSHIAQVLEYLKSSGLKLAILVNFGSDKVVFKRIVNFD